LASLAEQIDVYLTQRQSPLAGLGRRFVKAGRRYGVDPLLLVSIAGAESEFGTTGGGPKVNNAFGWGPHIPFPDWGTGIDTVAKGLRTGYLDQGLKTIAQIGGKWAPVGASNDPTGLNNQWVRNVSALYQELGGKGAKVGPGRRPFAPGARSGGRSRGARKQAALSFLLQTAQGGGGQPSDLLASLAEARAQRWGGTTKAKRPRVSDASTQSVIDAAMSQLGKPYVWGGESPGEGGFDCSGLIDWAMRQAGIKLEGRLTTWTAMKMGRSVRNGKVRAGDWVITNGGKHMVLAIGGGKVIAAPRSGEPVQVQDLARFRGDIVDIRRVL